MKTDDDIQYLVISIKPKLKWMLLLLTSIGLFILFYWGIDLKKSLYHNIMISIGFYTPFYLLYRFKIFKGIFDNEGYRIIWELVISGKIFLKKEVYFIPWGQMDIFIFRTWPLRPYGVSLNNSNFPQLSQSFHTNYSEAMRLLLEELPHKIKSEKDREYLNSFL